MKLYTVLKVMNRKHFVKFVMIFTWNDLKLETQYNNIPKNNSSNNFLFQNILFYK